MHAMRIMAKAFFIFPAKFTVFEIGAKIKTTKMICCTVLEPA